MGVRRRLARWALVALAVPLSARLADDSRSSASKRAAGPNRSSRSLRAVAARLARSAGPPHPSKMMHDRSPVA